MYLSENREIRRLTRCVAQGAVYGQSSGCEQLCFVYLMKFEKANCQVVERLGHAGQMVRRLKVIIGQGEISGCLVETPSVQLKAPFGQCLMSPVNQEVLLVFIFGRAGTTQDEKDQDSEIEKALHLVTPLTSGTWTLGAGSGGRLSRMKKFFFTDSRMLFVSLSASSICLCISGALSIAVFSWDMT